MAELQEVLVGGDRRLVREYHDDRGEPVTPPLALPQQPLLDESGHGLAAGLADELKVRGVPGSLLQGGSHAPLQGVKLVVLIEARPATLGAALHFGSVNRGRKTGADLRSQDHANLVAGGQPPRVREPQVVSEGDRHADFGNCGPQVHPAPAGPLLVGALEGLVTAEDGQLKDIALGRGDVRNALAKGGGDVAGGKVAGDLGNLVDDTVQSVLNAAHSLKVDRKSTRLNSSH